MPAGTAAVELTVDVALVLPEEAAFEIPNQGIVAFFSSGEAESLRTGYGRIRADGGICHAFGNRHVRVPR